MANSVELIPQDKSNACWLASSSMMETWKTGTHHSLTDTLAVLDASGTDFSSIYNNDNGLSFDNNKIITQTLGLTALPPASYTIEYLTSRLDASPIMAVIMFSSGANIAHMIVITGISGDGTPDGTTLQINDPLPMNTGKTYTIAFNDFLSKFEQVVAFENNFPAADLTSQLFYFAASDTTSNSSSADTTDNSSSTQPDNTSSSTDQSNTAGGTDNGNTSNSEDATQAAGGDNGDAPTQPYTVESWRSLVTQLAGSLPTEVVLRWIKHESGGNPCSTGKIVNGSSIENGLFQLYSPDDDHFASPAQLHGSFCDGQTCTRDLTGAEANTQVTSGIAYISQCRDRAKNQLSQAGVSWDETGKDFWSLVKMQHNLPSIPVQYIPKLHPSSWAAFKQGVINEHPEYSDGSSTIFTNAEDIGAAA